MKRDAKMTFGQAQRREEGSWTSSPMEMNLKLNGTISASAPVSLGYLLFQRCQALTDMRYWALPFA